MKTWTLMAMAGMLAGLTLPAAAQEKPPPVPADGKPNVDPSRDGSANGPPAPTERQPGAAPDAG